MTDTIWFSLGQTFLGIALTVLGARFLVNSAIQLAQAWGVSQAVIGLTIVAVGTSLPELITSVMSSIKGHNDVAFGNVVGSNIFNILFILGSASALTTINASNLLFIDTIILMGITLVMYIFGKTGNKTNRAEGLACIAMYAAYAAYITLR